MIRDRIEQDLDPLCAILEALQWPPAAVSGPDARAWLHEPDAERSWVFDMAPVHVTPTRNVVGHVQIRRSAGAEDQELVIGRLFVRPDTHVTGIGRFLLRESLRYVRDRGMEPVVALAECRFERPFFERYGVERFR
ncbi:GNAT family N-acetyltransferase [Nocardioides sp. SYSU DS0651]|uniref:GNAT family N-acetyltransferase n=1 Tax=Nocardioides sp. SYSU DS0651 TaxID=3415955 RepID=UPI003F4C50B8